ncbi:hypothetical protein QL285_000068 [Trifolium repens]|nr:hypothetical protein QL285_000068 [Trifolium repens]
MANINDPSPLPPYSPIFYCEHCNKPWHRKKNCFKLHGKEQGLNLGQTIGIAKEKEGLYYFSDEPDGPKSQGENINDLESESEFLVLGPSLPRTHVHAPTSVLEESTPSTPIQESGEDGITNRTIQRTYLQASND